ncbi:MAG TPA: AI-2E family transporter [Gammaproteobacteria bacterium]|nr:AI-2E family transporter [Gammaproteobacteria bacterium]
MSAYNKTITISLAILAVIGIFYVLVVGKTLLVPLAVAVMIWYIINALSKTYQKWLIPQLGKPEWLTKLFAVLSIGAAAFFVFNIIEASIGTVVEQVPVYRANLNSLIGEWFSQYGLEKYLDVTEITQSIEVVPFIRELGTALTGLFGKSFLVLIYVLFLLLEQTRFDSKIASLFPNTVRRTEIRSLITRTQDDIQTYIWIKTLASITTGLASYSILLFVGVDFPEFWAFLIFMLNYIPTIGSIIATLFPAVLTLVQFEAPLQPFLIVLLSVGSIQFLIGSVIEPRLLGDSLNLSPLVVLLSLALWGSVWGIAGMFLCVPLTVICVIILAHFSQTRPIAVLLSGNGKLRFIEN